jgi:hypothetical protein
MPKKRQFKLGILRHLKLGITPEIEKRSRPHTNKIVIIRGSIAAMDLLFSDHPKRFDLISIYLSGLMISIGNHRLLKHASVEDK